MKNWQKWKKLLNKKKKSIQMKMKKKTGIQLKKMLRKLTKNNGQRHSFFSNDFD